MVNKKIEEIERLLNEINSGVDNEAPYLFKYSIEKEVHFNPDYDKDAECLCGHPYHRHFDSYDDMTPVGCKYCTCFDFEKATFKLPEYVWLHKSALKKRNSEYYRIGGAWDVKFKVVGDKLYSISDMEHLNNRELIPCTKEEWEKDNKGYI